MSTTDWPTPERPYQQDLTFQPNEGQVIAEGKSYYPVLLRLNLTKQMILKISVDLLQVYRYMEEDQNDFQYTLSGDIRPMEEES